MNYSTALRTFRPTGTVVSGDPVRDLLIGADETTGGRVLLAVLSPGARADPTVREHLLERCPKQVATLQERIAAMKEPCAELAQILDQGDWGLVWQFQEGKTLGEHLSAPLDAPRAARLLLPLARLLREAGSVGMPHGKLSLDNVLVSGGGELVLVEFGEGAAWDLLASASGGELSLDRAHARYRGPERRGRAAPPTPADDLFAFGELWCRVRTGSESTVAGDEPGLHKRERRLLKRLRAEDPGQRDVALWNLIISELEDFADGRLEESSGPLPSPEPAAEAPPAPPARRGRLKRALLVGIGALLLLGAFAVVGYFKWLAPRTVPILSVPPGAGVYDAVLGDQLCTATPDCSLELRRGEIREAYMRLDGYRSTEVRLAFNEPPKGPIRLAPIRIQVSCETPGAMLFRSDGGQAVPWIWEPRDACRPGMSLEVRAPGHAPATIVISNCNRDLVRIVTLRPLPLEPVTLPTEVKRPRAPDQEPDEAVRRRKLRDLEKEHDKAKEDYDRAPIHPGIDERWLATIEQGITLKDPPNACRSLRELRSYGSRDCGDRTARLAELLARLEVLKALCRKSPGPIVELALPDLYNLKLCL